MEADSRAWRKGLCWKAPLAQRWLTLQEYNCRKYNDETLCYRIHLEAQNAHTHAKLHQRRDTWWGQQSRRVSTECVYDSFICCSHVTRVVFVWRVLIRFERTTTTTANTSYTNTQTHTKVIYEVVDVASLTCVNGNVVLQTFPSWEHKVNFVKEAEGYYPAAEHFYCIPSLVYILTPACHSHTHPCLQIKKTCTVFAGV